jgi:hypothetical protein
MVTDSLRGEEEAALRRATRFRVRSPQRRDSRASSQIAMPAVLSGSGGRSPRSTHSTRKTCGSLLAALKVHPRVAMQILGHSKVARQPPPSAEQAGAVAGRDGHDPLLHFATAPRSTRVVVVVEQNSGLGGAKGTRIPGLLDANHIFCVFLRRLTSPDEASTCGDRRRVSVGVAGCRWASPGVGLRWLFVWLF